MSPAEAIWPANMSSSVCVSVGGLLGRDGNQTTAYSQLQREMGNGPAIRAKLNSLLLYHP